MDSHSHSSRLTSNISTEENNYLCGGVKYEEDAAKEKRRRRKRNIPFLSPSFFLRSVLFVVYAPAEVNIFFSADIPWNRLGEGLHQM